MLHLVRAAATMNAVLWAWFGFPLRAGGIAHLAAVLLGLALWHAAYEEH